MTQPLQPLLDDVRASFNCAACSFAQLDEDEGELIYGPASGVGADPSRFASVISVAAAAGDELLVAETSPAQFGAPGLDVEVAWLGGGTLKVTGDSFAAQWVAGVVTRIVAAHPELRPYEVKAVLRSLAANIRPPGRS